MRTDLNDITAEGLMVNMAYICAFAAERLLLTAGRYIAMRGGSLRHDKKRAFTRLKETLAAADRQFSIAFDGDLINAIGRSGEILDYDRAHKDANEIARLLLLYSDRCGYSQKNYEELFRILRAMPDGLGKITEDVLKDFYMKK